jgi:hypothetical protein
MLQMWIMVWVTALVGLVGMAAIAWAAQRLPYAPHCPRCRGLTAGQAARQRVDRLWAMALATPVRRCEQCGWTGRMRWRVAAQRVSRS